MDTVDLGWLVFNMLVRYNLPAEPLLTADYQLLTKEMAEKLGMNDADNEAKEAEDWQSGPTV